MIAPQTPVLLPGCCGCLCYLLAEGKFIFCVHVELCKQTPNPQLVVCHPLGLSSITWVNTWLPMRQIPSFALPTKHQNFSSQAGGKLHWFSCFRAAHFDCLKEVCLYEGFSPCFYALCWESKIKTMKAFAALLASGSSERIHATLPSFPKHSRSYEQVTMKPLQLLGLKQILSLKISTAGYWALGLDCLEFFGGFIYFSLSGRLPCCCFF